MIGKRTLRYFLFFLFLPGVVHAEPEGHPESVRSLIDSLQRIQSVPDQRDRILRDLEKRTAETRERLEESAEEIRRIEALIRESEDRLETLEERMNALSVARNLLGVGPMEMETTSEPEIGFNASIRPILSDKCFACHGPDEKKRKAGLRLDQEDSAKGNGRSQSPAVVPGDRESSELWKRITSRDESERMPPSSQVKQLSEDEVELIGRWIDQGAPYEKHWAFVKPVRPRLPSVSDTGWCRNPIDRFVLARLEREGVSPSPPASKTTLLRRVYLDLIGIPPTPQEVSAFLQDKRPDAYERVVDRLLASPHYGERWARHWLDAARYADSNGYSIDGPREIWKYRDWVIDAFNNDMPFDRFTIEQLAGDLLPNANRSQKTATGFHRNTMINQEGGIDKEEFRIEAVLDRVNTTGTVFLGLTIGCVQCHEHKYDPIAHEEYYQLFAFFNQDDEAELTFPSEQEARVIAEIDQEIGLVREEWESYLKQAFDSHQVEWEKNIPEEEIRTLFLDKQEAVRTPRAERTPEQQKVVNELFKEKDERSRRFKKRIEELNARKPAVDRTLVLKRRPEPRITQVFIQGDFTRKGKEVRPAVLRALHPMKPVENPTRLDLARWIVDPENPLTARVTVNRFWQRFFGKGIVETENDFGSQGSLPTHPDLLDWLAVEFVENGWSVKSIHRLITTSATYRQSSDTRKDLNEIDPANELLARQNRIRLDAEIIRDSALAAAGLLNRRIKGPSVFPPLPDGVMGLGQVKREWIADSGPDRFRRGMYTFFWRATPHSFLMTFDAPNAMQTCTRRVRSNTPLQALTLLNDEAFFEMARALGERLATRVEGNSEDRIKTAFRLCLCREPVPEEVAVLGQLLARSADDDRAKWTRVARVLLNLDEFVTRE